VRTHFLESVPGWERTKKTSLPSNGSDFETNLSLINIVQVTLWLIDPRTGTLTTHEFPKKLPCLTSSQTTNELKCGVETKGLQVFDLSTLCWRRIEYQDTVKSVSSPPNGTVVANVAGFGLQQFYFHQDTYRVCYLLIPSLQKSGSFSYSIHVQIPLVEGPRRGHDVVDG
jgi:hypothetical protein